MLVHVTPPPSGSYVRFYSPPPKQMISLFFFFFRRNDSLAASVYHCGEGYKAVIHQGLSRIGHAPSLQLSLSGGV